jgi:hypothetical protein
MSDDHEFAGCFAAILGIGLIVLFVKLEIFIWATCGKQISVLSIFLTIYLLFKYGDTLGEIFEGICEGLSLLTAIAIVVGILVAFIHWFFN